MTYILSGSMEDLQCIALAPSCMRFTDLILIRSGSFNLCPQAVRDMGFCGAAVPIYVRHFLSSQPLGGSWRRSLASAMHARVRAVQQQDLPPAVLLPSPSLPPLFPHLAPPCRLPSALTAAPGSLGLLQPAARQSGPISSPNGVQSTPNGYSLHTRAEPSKLSNGSPWQTPLTTRQANGLPSLHAFGQPAANAWHFQPSQTSCAAALRSSSGVAVQPTQLQAPQNAQMPCGSGHALKVNKRKVTDADATFEQPESPVKRCLSGLHPNLASLEEQTANLQALIERSKQCE